VSGRSLSKGVATLSREQIVGGISDGPILRWYARAEAAATIAGDGHVASYVSP